MIFYYPVGDILLSRCLEAAGRLTWCYFEKEFKQWPVLERCKLGTLTVVRKVQASTSCIGSKGQSPSLRKIPKTPVNNILQHNPRAFATLIEHSNLHNSAQNVLFGAFKKIAQKYLFRHLSFPPVKIWQKISHAIDEHKQPPKPGGF